MPPEQVSSSNGQIGPTADVYSLGATLYALLAGRPPFQAASAIDTLKQVWRKNPRSLREFDANVPRDLETITLKCLEKVPRSPLSQRAALADELDRYLTGRPILARPVSRAEHAWRWCRRNPVVACLTAAVALSLIIGTIVSAFFSVQSHRRADDNLALAIQEKAARANAQLQQRLAENAQTKEAQLRRQAERQELVARQHSYDSDMNVVQLAFQSNNLRRALALLDHQHPPSDKVDLRGWEWRLRLAALPKQGSGDTVDGGWKCVRNTLSARGKSNCRGRAWWSMCDR